MSNPLTSAHPSRPITASHFPSCIGCDRFEISRIESEQKQRDWTLWAAFGGIASCLGLLSQQWENGGVKVADAAQLFLLASMIRDILHYARRQLSPVQQRTHKVSPRVICSLVLRARRGCLYAIRFAALFVLSVLFASRVHSSQWIPMLLFCWIFTLAGAIGLAPPTSTF
jgi:hypothetical protein